MRSELFFIAFAGTGILVIVLGVLFAMQVELTGAFFH